MSRYIDKGHGNYEQRAAMHEGRARQLDLKAGSVCAAAATRHREQATKLRKQARAALAKARI